MTSADSKRSRAEGNVRREIDPVPFAALVKAEKPEFGAAPMLKWIDIADLSVDPSYQRDIFRTGKKNVVAIAEAFDWTKFSPVIGGSN